MTRLFTTLFIAASFIVACSTNALTKKSQLTLMPESELQAMGTQQYQQFLSTSRVISASSNRDAEMVRRVGQRITRAVQEYYTQNGISDKLNGFNWEYNLVDDKAVNAWCMPGGKIVVYTGLLPITQNEAALAVGEVALSVALSNKPTETQNLFLAAYGAGATIGVMLPFSRKQELEADRFGLIWPAMAGYNPQEAIPLWERMERASQGGQKPPEFLSTHPSEGTRIEELQKYMPEAMKYYKPMAKY
jgi:predicted Zn-dependent protease